MAIQYDNMVHEITTVTRKRTRNILNNLESLSVSLTTQANQAYMEWPFVVFRDFQVQGMVSNQVTGASTLTLHPIVRARERQAWEVFSAEEAPKWLRRAHMIYDEQVNENLYHAGNKTAEAQLREEKLEILYKDDKWDREGAVTPYLWLYNDDLQRAVDYDDTFYAPKWQQAPAEDLNPTTNQNVAHIGNARQVILGLAKYDQPAMTVSGTDDSVLTNHYYPEAPLAVSQGGLRKLQEEQEQADTEDGVVQEGTDGYYQEGTPHSYLLQPIHDNLFANRTVVGFLSAYLQWDSLFKEAVPETVTEPILLVLDGTCENQTMTFELVGNQVFFLGEADLHDPHFESMRRDVAFDALAVDTTTQEEDLFCRYSARVYPSEAWAASHFSDMPIVYAVLVICCFLITTILFAVYDILVQKRQDLVMESAAKTSAIVTSLFPSNVRDRLLEELKPAQSTQEKLKQSLCHPPGSCGPGPFNNVDSSGHFTPQTRRNSSGSLGAGVETSEMIFGSKPIADLFPATTILFQDMAGFTAWSSSREPTQVFTLLETVYHAFDEIAKRRRIFKGNFFHSWLRHEGSLF